jgi:hypothetical protein
MTPPPTDMIQSFRLRFWRESRQGLSEDWRGDVWHEQQKPDEEAVVVANPEAAFELVRQTLRFFSGTNDAETHPNQRAGINEPGSASSREPPAGTTNRANPLLSIWRRIRGERP